MIFYPKVALLASAPLLLLVAEVGPTSEFQVLTGLGIGGLLAFITMRYYREDRKASEERYAADRKASEERYAADRKASEERMAALANEYRKNIIENTVAITSNTDATLRLRDLLISGSEGRDHGKP